MLLYKPNAVLGIRSWSHLEFLIRNSSKKWPIYLGYSLLPKAQWNQNGGEDFLKLYFRQNLFFFFGTLTWCLNTSREKSKYLKNDFLYDSKIVLFLLCDTKKGCEAALLQFRSIRNFLNSQLISCCLKLFFCSCIYEMSDCMKSWSAFYL